MWVAAICSVAIQLISPGKFSIQNFQFQIWAKGEQTSTYSGKEHLFILMGIKSYYSQNTFTVVEFSNFVKTKKWKNYKSP